MFKRYRGSHGDFNSFHVHGDYAILEYGSVHSCKLIGQLQVSKSLRDLLAEVLRDLQLLQAKLQLVQAIIYNFYKLTYNFNKISCVMKDNRPAWAGLGISLEQVERIERG